MPVEKALPNNRTAFNINKVYTSLDIAMRTRNRRVGDLRSIILWLTFGRRWNGFRAVPDAIVIRADLHITRAKLLYIRHILLPRY